MKKTDYIIRQIGKSYKKKYENYVVTRIWHLVNNLDIKFITQQHVTKPEGRALTDMYFPQIQLHIEVDEGHHFNSKGLQIDQDAIRELDIINATGHTVKRIKVVQESIENINKEIDEVVDFIKKEINSINFLPWNIDAEYNPQTYIDKGSISVQDNVAFLTTKDACNCFGHKYKGYQQATAKHAVEDRILWFPKLYENKGWRNEISLDEDKIFMQKIGDHKKWFDENKDKPDSLKEWVVFARVKSNLGDVMYRFKGVYKIDLINSETLGKVIFNRIEKTVKTYKPLSL